MSDGGVGSEDIKTRAYPGCGSLQSGYEKSTSFLVGKLGCGP